mmetsp:Transcript_53777/g.64877  ORF Transcript_53777/g.64877 Transcript_53777/m.64877 type:complete len:283 (+) Transcript_53777:226-1074(+)
MAQRYFYLRPSLYPISVVIAIFIIISIPPSTIAHERKKHNEKCYLKCKHGGKCNKIPLSTNSTSALPEECLCAAGYHGILCEITTKQCEENTVDKYLQCACDDFAGRDCNAPVSTVCVDEDGYSLDKNKYCTNGGICPNKTSEDEEGSVDKYCKCTDGFTGHHCEHFNGVSLKKSTVGHAGSESESESLHTKLKYISIWGISLVVFVYVAVGLKNKFQEHKIRQRYNAEAAIATAELALDFDDDLDADFDDYHDEVEFADLSPSKPLPKKVDEDSYALVGFT